MITSKLLDQLLKAGQQAVSGSSQGGAGGAGALGELLSGSGLGSLLGGKGNGALAAGALGLLLGTKGGRKLGGKALTYGGLAAVGLMAYKAYNSWQEKQPQQASQAPLQTVDRVAPAMVEQHSRAILVALVAAAKADGHIDERERGLIEAELGKLAEDAELRNWLRNELHKPLDPVQVASAAQTPEMAAEMYLASVLMVDQDSYMERAYLDELARQLKLPESLARELEQQVRSH